MSSNGKYRRHQTELRVQQWCFHIGNWLKLYNLSHLKYTQICVCWFKAWKKESIATSLILKRGPFLLLSVITIFLFQKIIWMHSRKNAYFLRISFRQNELYFAGSIDLCYKNINSFKYNSAILVTLLRQIHGLFVLLLFLHKPLI